MKLIVEKERFLYENQSVELESLFTQDFYNYSNEIAKEYLNDSYVVNEVFLFSVQTYLAVEKFIIDKKVDYIDFRNAASPLNLYLKYIVEKYSIKHECSNISWHKLGILMRYHVLHFASFLYFGYLFLRIPYKKGEFCVQKKFAVLRQKSAINKFKEFKDVNQEIEDPFSSNSVYRLYSKTKRMKWTFKAYFCSFSYIKKIRVFYKKLVGKSSVYWLYTFYAKRIVHTLIYKELMDDYLPKNKGGIYYTGSNLDRYSVVEEQIANKLNMKTVCLPHGLEYGFKSPKGFSCDVFYATSDKAAEDLNKLYETNKFVFDAEVTRKMYERQGANIQKDRKVVFFTESREVHVNQQIIEEIIPLLQAKNIKLYLKLHPDDKKSDYDQYHLEYLTDYNEAIIGNICFARKSTVLLEALYNHSIPLAILINSKDSSIYGTFPSLNQDKIKVTYSVSELADEIIKNLK